MSQVELGLAEASGMFGLGLKMINDIDNDNL